MPSSVITHSRYFSKFKYTGTPPSGKTIRRLKAQNSLGLSPIRKLAVTQNGTVQHPTKCSRTIRSRINSSGKRCRGGWGRIFGYVSHTGYVKPKEFSESQKIVQKLTNHERKRLYGIAKEVRCTLGDIPAKILRARFDVTGERFANVPKG